MKMLIFVLNRVEKLEPALNKLEHAGLRGATVLSSRGMAMTLDKYCDGSFLGSLRAMMEDSKLYSILTGVALVAVLLAVSSAFTIWKMRRLSPVALMKKDDAD